MAQNSSGKRGNAPQVAVVIGVVLILIGAWNLVNVLVPAAAISSLINFIRHLWNVVWPCGLLAAGGICCGRLNLESCRALLSLATMRRFAARVLTSASSAYAAESRITLASTLRWFALSRLFCSPHFPRWPRWRTWLLLFLCRRCEAAGAIRGVDFEPSRFRDIIG